MSGLAEFLLARCAEEEAIAREAAEDEGGRWLVDGPFSLVASFGEHGDRMGAWSGLTQLRRSTIAPHIARWDPSRVLAECEARRRIVESCDTILRDEDGYFATLDVPEGAAIATNHLRILAAVYSDHPAYDPSWRV